MNDIAIQCAARVDMELDWAPIRHLLGGTRAMRQAGQAYLPREQAESEADYRRRLARSYLYGGLKQAIEELGSKPFQKPPTLDKISGKLGKIEANVDRVGTPMHLFVKKCLAHKMAFGKYHILVDMPSEKAVNLKDEESRDFRPYFVFVPADAVIAWKTEIHDSRRVLVDVRIAESVNVGEENVTTKNPPRIRRWYVKYQGDEVVEAKWEIWESNGQSDYALSKSDDNPLKVIPLVIDYAEEEEFMVARPPLREIGDLDIAHWQSASDQRNILRFARAPIIWRSGVSTEEANQAIVVGAGASYASTIAGATMEFVEHGGAAIEAGAKDLADLEEKMRLLAMRPLIETAGNPTATGAALDEARTNCVLKKWVRDVELAILRAYQFAAKWADETLPQNWKGLDIFDEFGLSVRAAEDTRQLIQLRKDREITRRTLLEEVKRRGLLSDTFDIDQEIQDLEDEGPDLTDISDFLAGMREPKKLDQNAPQPNSPGPNGPSGPPKDPAQQAA